MDKQKTTHLFDELVIHIKGAPWFTEEWGVYRDGNYIHIFKNTWLEENHNGVHFETYVGDDPIYPVVLHAEKDVPDRDAFVRRVVAAIGQQKGFTVGANEYTILKKELFFDAETFIADVLTVLKEMQFVVKIVDEHLQ